MTVLITGATGFLGSRIAHSLLTNRRQRVIALGRGELSTVRARTVRALQACGAGALEEQALGRLRCVSGDITRQWLGLPPALYARLAQEVDEVWHCAGDIALAGERERLFATNAQGTAHMLEFIDTTTSDCRLVHVSTMAVAGGRSRGHIMEDDLTDAYGFATFYDASKYEGEKLVRQWARSRQRGAVILRPSVVACDRPLSDGAPGHPLSVFGQLLETVARGGAPGIPAQRPQGARVRLRLQASPRATFNILPDSYATEAMVRIGCDAPRGPQDVQTFHVVHPQPTPMSRLVGVLEDHFPGLRIECVEEVPDPTDAERFIASHLNGFLSYCRHDRTYDRTHTLAATPGLAEPATVDSAYLRRALGFGPPRPYKAPSSSASRR
ncbi:SDR family oxidoreductase [Streptomyces sp. NPDC006368]|uniref:SDR family oxidoreductase n=1 Tax=Streptomyces sp. NPDC006368 TaxID=3156760 RepID=UPI0033B5C6D9